MCLQQMVKLNTSGTCVRRAHLQNQQRHLRDFVSILFLSQFPLFVSLFPDYLHYIGRMPKNTAVQCISPQKVFLLININCLLHAYLLAKSATDTEK